MPTNLPFNQQLTQVPVGAVVDAAPGVPTLYAWDSTKPTISQTREAAINSIQANFAALNSGVAALPYLPLAGGVSMSGSFNLVGNASSNLHPVPYQQLVSYLAANNGVVTFNTRAGAVTLSSADVLAALGYTPANKAGESFTGNVSTSTVMTAKSFIPTVQTLSAVSGNIALDHNVAQHYNINPNGNITFNSANFYNGTIMRVWIYPTNVGSITFAIAGRTVVWPMSGSTAPNFAAGPQKATMITLVLDNSFTGWIAATASIY